MDHLTALFQEMWRQGEVPQDFKDATIVHLYKRKGNRQVCDNHRGISLLNIAGKIFARILLNRLNNHLEQGLLPESQCGFRRHRGTTDMIFAARQLQEKCQEMRTHLYSTFVDLTKAFDTANREGLWKIMQKFGCPERFTHMVRQLHDAIVPPPASSSSLPPTNSDIPSASPLPSSSFSSTDPAAAVQTAVSHITNTNTPTNITSPTSPDSSDEDQVYTCPHCDRTFTSHIGLVGHLRIHRTEAGEIVPGAPTYTHRTRLHCPQCPRTFTHRMGLFGHMRIHESGIDRSLDTSTPPSPTPNPPPCAPTNHSPADIDATDLTTPHSSPSSSSSSFTATTTAASASVAHDFTTAEFDTTTGTTPATSIIRREGQGYICPHCDRTFTSRIGLVGHLRIHRTETGEPVPGAPTYTHRTRLHCPHCPRTFRHRMGLFGHMRIHEIGTDHNSDTATTSNTSTTPRPILAPPSHASTTTTNITASSTDDTDTANLSCPHCPRTFTSRIGLSLMKGSSENPKQRTNNLLVPVTESSSELPS
nr:unnamed protein product [Spirometra erinaceieuropaei]